MIDIMLTSGMRSALLSMRGTKKNIDRVQERLTTGKKVNSALDNPTNFFAATSHRDRASGLSGRKDGIIEGIQTIKVADVGIKAISTLLDSMKGVAEAALGTSSQAERTSLQKSFTEMANQIDSLASDSNYRGMNLLASQDLVIQFNETSGASTLTVTGADSTANGLGLLNDKYVSSRGADGTSTVNITKNGTLISAPAAPLPFGPFDSIAANGTTTYLQIDTGDVLGSSIWGFDATSGASFWTNLGFNTPNGVNFGFSPVTVTVPKQPWTSDKVIINAETSVDAALSTLRSRTKLLSSNLNIAITRLDFITLMGNILQSGADNLTLADMNEQSADMLSLQTKQNLEVSSLQMASQTSQSVLRIF